MARQGAPTPKTPQEWVYERAGVRISELDFTIEDCERLDEMTGMTWAVSFPTASPKIARCWLEVAFGRLELDDPAGKARRMTWRDIVGAFKTVDTDVLQLGAKDGEGNVPLVAEPTGTG